MIVIDNFLQVAAQIESERGVSKEVLTSAIEQALVSACRRKFTEETLLEAVINQETGEASIYQRLHIVESVEDPEIEIDLVGAKKVDPTAKVGGDLVIDVTPADFGRIAAQTAKQVIIQRIREAEKNGIYDEFKVKEDQLITGTVQRIENRNFLINLGRTETILGPNDQIPDEIFHPKDKIRLYLVAVNKTPRGPFIHVSRSHPGLLKKLFEVEIPEIQDGIVEIVSVAREAGKRSKIAVKTNNPSIGAVGTCVGPMGGRIQSIIKELGNEKIDILEYHENPRTYISNSLKPAKISEVIITDERERTALVSVPKDQLSLAIGKFGINVRLAVRLTGWKLDILSEEEFAKRAPEIREKLQLSIVEKIKLDKEKLKQEEAARLKAMPIEEPTPEPEVIEAVEPEVTPIEEPKMELPVEAPAIEPVVKAVVEPVIVKKSVEAPEKLEKVAPPVAALAAVQPPAIDDFAMAAPKLPRAQPKPVPAKKAPAPQPKPKAAAPKPENLGQVQAERAQKDVLSAQEVYLGEEVMEEDEIKLSVLAKRLNLTVKQMVEKAKALGIPAKDGSAWVSKQQVTQIKESISQ